MVNDRVSAGDWKKATAPATASKIASPPMTPRVPGTSGAIRPGHQVDPSTFYRWEKQAKEGMREDLQGRRPRNGKAAEREIERLEAELDKKRGIIAEVVEENLELKRGL